MSGPPNHWRDQNSCGVACLFVLLKLDGYDVSYDAIAARVPVEKEGSNLSDLCQCSAERGLPLAACRSTPHEFDKLPMPLIARLGSERREAPSHYVVVVRAEATLVYLIDASFAPRVVKQARGDFFRRWSGEVLIPAEQRALGPSTLEIALVISSVALALVLVFLAFPVPFSRGGTKQAAKALFSLAGLALLGCSSEVPPDSSASESGLKPGTFISVLSHEKDVGLIPLLGEAHADFEIRNAGPEPAELELGYPSCACSHASLSKNIVPPLESTTLHLVVRNERRNAGPVAASIVVADAKHKWSQSFRVDGICDGLGTSPYVTQIPTDPIPTDALAEFALYSSRPENDYVVSTSLEPAEFGSWLRVGKPQISLARQTDLYCESRVTVPMHFIGAPGRLAGRLVRGSLELQMRYGKQQLHASRPLEIDFRKKK